MNRFVKILDVPWPTPVMDTQTGRLLHDDRCWNDDGPDLCVCGLDEAQVDAALIQMEQA